MDLEYLYRRAYDIADSECVMKKRHVSFILSAHTGDILSSGVNRPSVTIDGAYRSLHSERDAVLRAGTSVDELVLVNFRLNKSGDLRNSKPCPLCWEWARDTFSSVYYSTDQGMVLVVPFRTPIGRL